MMLRPAAAPPGRLSKTPCPDTVFPACRRAAGQIAGMDLQLVPVRIEKIERFAFAAIALPLFDAVLAQPLADLLNVFRRYAEGVMGVIARALLRPGLIPRQTQPQRPQREISAALPAGVRGKPQQMTIKFEAAIEIADGERQVIEAGQHACISALNRGKSVRRR